MFEVANQGQPNMPVSRIKLKFREMSDQSIYIYHVHTVKKKYLNQL